MNLTDLGWHPTFQEGLDALEQPAWLPGRVARQDVHRYQILTPEGTFAAEVSGKFRNDASASADFPAVGDWVAATFRPREGAATIHAVLPRKSQFSRKVAGTTTREQVVAANVDIIFLVTGLDNDFNLRRIERYVTLAWNSGALPVILLNKTDLVDDLEGKLVAVEAVAMGVDIHALSATEGDGVDAVRWYLGSGQTVAFLGSSGVGKSTLVNQLLGEERMTTAAVREADSRGRHTTTHRELFLASNGGIVIDTPGMRELQLWANEDSLEGAFADIEELAARCRFNDCAHDTEPGCAVVAALEGGTLTEDRFASYMKLRRELAYLERRQQESSREEHQRQKTMGKLYKTIQQHNVKAKREE